MLVGRDAELARVRRLVDDAREGRSGALILTGPAGIGKSALLEEVLRSAEGMTVLRARGVEAESDIPFAGLSELVTPLLDHRDRIPEVQATALAGALALEPAAAQDRFAVPASLLSLLAAAAEERPVLAVVDDVQWVDEASMEAGLFAARRLDAEGIALLFAARGSGPAFDRPGVERVHLGSLEEQAARDLLADCVPKGTPASVTEALLSTAAGNPLAICELPELLDADQLAGRVPLPEPLAPGAGVESAYTARLSRLPEEGARALAVAAAEPGRRLDVLEAALTTVGLGVDALEPAVEAGLLTMSEGRFGFHHPLLRATAYHRAPAAERRAAHRALAAALPEGSAEAAWQLAAAAIGPDEAVAEALARAGADARGRGAPASAAHALERAAQLTPDPDVRAGRALEAARDYAATGRPERALPLVDGALEATEDPMARADLRTLRGAVQIRLGDLEGAYRTLVDEADRIREADHARAAAMYLQAAPAHMMTGNMPALIGSAEQAIQINQGANPMIDVLGALIIAEAKLALGDPDGNKTIAEMEELLTSNVPPPELIEVVGMAAHSSLWFEHYDRASRIVEHLVRSGRESSSVNLLIYPLAVRAHLLMRRGQLPQAYADAEESVRLADQTGQSALLCHSLAALAEVEALRGDAENCRIHAQGCLDLVPVVRGEATEPYARAARGHLELSLGDVDAAIAALEIVRERAEALDMVETLMLWRPDLIEAYVRAGRTREARAEIDKLDRAAQATGVRWINAAVARSLALLASEDEYEKAFRLALRLAEQLDQPLEGARVQLLLGERRRRSKRRAEARPPLQAAQAAFERIGATAWAERARTELRATGQTIEEARPAALEELTAHELQIALHVARGMTNRQTAAALFLSPKTIEYHLGQIYRKLDLRSRTQLATLLAAELPQAA